MAEHPAQALFDQFDAAILDISAITGRPIAMDDSDSAVDARLKTAGAAVEALVAEANRLRTEEQRKPEKTDNTRGKQEQSSVARAHGRRLNPTPMAHFRARRESVIDTEYQTVSE